MAEHYYYSIASGSSGNCGLYMADGTAILIDLGVSLRRITTALKALSLTLEDISAVVLNVFDSGERFWVRDVDVVPFPTPHDAAESTGYIFEHGGSRFGFATDLGFVPRDAAELLRGCEMVVLESNHDPHMLQAGPYPYSLKMRVAGPSGHLSNPDCAVFAADLVKSGTRTLVLAHLSEKNNMPELARQQTLSALRGLPACEVLVAPKEHMEHPVSFGEEKLCSLSG